MAKKRLLVFVTLLLIPIVCKLTNSRTDNVQVFLLLLPKYQKIIEVVNIVYFLASDEIRWG